MADLISREAVIALINASISDLEYADENIAMQEAIKMLPTIEAEPVKHGHWIAVENGNDGDTKCSRCGCYHHVWEAYGYYCQHCGAKMFDEDINVLNKMDEVEE